MAMGAKARDPNTPYEVYEFSVNGRVYYVGIGQSIAGNGKSKPTRATDRWNYVGRQLERLEREGRLPLGKMRDIKKLSGAVIREMIERGMDEHDITRPWQGKGRAEALRQEALRIKVLIAQDCKLANIRGNANPAPTVEQILQYLGVKQHKQE